MAQVQEFFESLPNCLHNMLEIILRYVIKRLKMIASRQYLRASELYAWYTCRKCCNMHKHRSHTWQCKHLGAMGQKTILLELCSTKYQKRKPQDNTLYELNKMRKVCTYKYMGEAVRQEIINAHICGI